VLNWTNLRKLPNARNCLKLTICGIH